MPGTPEQPTAPDNSAAVPTEPPVTDAAEVPVTDAAEVPVTGAPEPSESSEPCEPSEPSELSAPNTPAPSKISEAERRRLDQETKDERQVWWYLGYFLFGIHLVAWIMIFAVRHAK